MRTLGYLALLVVAATGPVLYLTVGANARARRNTAARHAVAERDAVNALLAADAPPSDTALKEVETALAARQRSLRELQDAIATAQAAPAPSIGELLGRAKDLELDAPVVDALLAGADGADAGATARRHVLGSVLGVTSNAMLVERMRCASKATPIAGLALEGWRVDLALVAPLVVVEHAIEALCSGDATRSPARVATMKITHTRPEEWAELAARFDQPPVRLECSIDVLRDTRSAP